MEQKTKSCHPHLFVRVTEDIMKHAPALLVICFLTLVCLGAPGRASAQANTKPGDIEAIAVEPILTEESLPEEKGECNVRMTAAYHVEAAEPATALPRTQVFCGFSSRWGGEFDVPFAQGSGAQGRYGLGDISASVKYKLREQTARIPAFVLGLETMLPTGSPEKGTGETGVEVQPFVALLKQVHSVSVQGNIGLGMRHSGSEREYRTSYNGAVGLPLRQTGFALMGEVNGSYSPSGPPAISVTPGVHYEIGKNRYVAFGMPVSLAGARQVGAIVQFQFRVRSQRGLD
jgi:Putative MetA-pathway of phenol degradation